MARGPPLLLRLEISCHSCMCEIVQTKTFWMLTKRIEAVEIPEWWSNYRTVLYPQPCGSQTDWIRCLLLYYTQQLCTGLDLSTTLRSRPGSSSFWTSSQPHGSPWSPLAHEPWSLLHPALPNQASSLRTKSPAPFRHGRGQGGQTRKAEK